MPDNRITLVSLGQEVDINVNINVFVYFTYMEIGYTKTCFLTSGWAHPTLFSSETELTNIF